MENIEFYFGSSSNDRYDRNIVNTNHKETNMKRKFSDSYEEHEGPLNQTSNDDLGSCHVKKRFAYCKHSQSTVQSKNDLKNSVFECEHCRLADDSGFENQNSGFSLIEESIDFVNSNNENYFAEGTDKIICEISEILNEIIVIIEKDTEYFNFSHIVDMSTISYVDINKSNIIKSDDRNDNYQMKDDNKFSVHTSPNNIVNWIDPKKCDEQADTTKMDGQICVYPDFFMEVDAENNLKKHSSTQIEHSSTIHNQGFKSMNDSFDILSPIKFRGDLYNDDDCDNDIDVEYEEANLVQENIEDSVDFSPIKFRTDVYNIDKESEEEINAQHCILSNQTEYKKCLFISSNAPEQSTNSPYKKEQLNELLLPTCFYFGTPINRNENNTAVDDLTNLSRNDIDVGKSDNKEFDLSKSIVVCDIYDDLAFGNTSNLIAIDKNNTFSQNETRLSSNGSEKNIANNSERNSLTLLNNDNITNIAPNNFYFGSKIPESSCSVFESDPIDKMEEIDDLTEDKLNKSNDSIGQPTLIEFHENIAILVPKYSRANSFLNNLDDSTLVNEPVVEKKDYESFYKSFEDMSFSSDDDELLFKPSLNDLVKYEVETEAVMKNISNESIVAKGDKNSVNSGFCSSSPQRPNKNILSSSRFVNDYDNGYNKSLFNCELSSVGEVSDEDNNHRVLSFLDNCIAPDSINNSSSSNNTLYDSMNQSLLANNSSSFHSTVGYSTNHRNEMATDNEDENYEQFEKNMNKNRFNAFRSTTFESSLKTSKELASDKNVLSDASSKLNIVNLSKNNMYTIYENDNKDVPDEKCAISDFKSPFIPVLAQSLNVKKALLKKAASNINVGAMGDKAYETYRTQQTLTLDVLEILHKSLETRPSPNVYLDDPLGLNVPLMLHQKHAIAWLMWRESQIPHGGILADDMGLGKTLTMISLILKASETGKDNIMLNEKNANARSPTGGTLIVCPASLIQQWEVEILSKLESQLITVGLYYGSKRKHSVEDLLAKNIIITSYQTVMWDQKLSTTSPLFKIKWLRIILDEAHIIRNNKSCTSIAICNLSSIFRWAITGTPIHNKEADFYTLLKFIGCKPFDDWGIWKRWVGNNDRIGSERLALIANVVMLRRTKQELSQLTSFNLPTKTFQVVPVKLCKEEKEAYEQLLLFSSNLFEKYLIEKAQKENAVYDYDFKLHNNIKYLDVLEQKQGKGNVFKGYPELQKLFQQLKNIEAVQTFHIIVLLLRLRQMCCHPCLIKGKVESNDLIKSECPDTDSNVKDLNEFSLSEEQDDNKLCSGSKIFEETWISSKIKAVCELVKEKVLGTDDKAIIVSQWPSMLHLVRNRLLLYNVEMDLYTGAVPIMARSKVMNRFNDPNGGPKILLLSLTAGGVGLNLVSANHMFLVDIHWNPQLEAQACDRIYRVGQTKPVYVYKFICTDTIETSIQALQNKKLEIAENLFHGTNKAASSKLSLNDLMEIFKVK
ncbi:uncharacterized protein LOC126833731 [Adelges cooleyi]|uniref:uncharacterized protein LOC126833731 n=1 Tax=Adelges cooleyi TaxID=133065 RepID=UPI00218016CD|nr:uncharacterized protein LOC126833731 [Adelges cooleyi]